MKNRKQDKKILMISWGSAIFGDVVEALKKYGYQIEEVLWNDGDYDDNPEFVRILKEQLENDDYEFVFSFNYFPVVSKVCQSQTKKYISWVYDSPHLTLYSKTVFFPCNYIFHFDSSTVEELKRYGVEKVFYLPMAANTDRLDALENPCEKEMDVSFVGGIYEDNFYRQIPYLPEYIKGYLEGIMKVQEQIYGCNVLEQLLTDELMKKIKQYVKFGLNEQYFATDKQVFSSLFLGKNVTFQERKTVLEMISEICELSLYTYNPSLVIDGVKNKGYANYMDTMPRIFKQSKINLNITLKTIKTGIPLRVFDVLGAGGFLITNYQSDFMEYFTPDEDLIVYENYQDLLRKVEYYLKHDDEREQIAVNGHQKVKKYHSYEKRIGSILEKIKEAEENE